MPSTEQNKQGGRLNTFALANRVLDNDPYWVEVNAMAPVASVISISYNQYYLHGDVLATDAWSYTDFNGLVGVLDAQGQATDIGEFGIVMTGTESGGVKVTVDVLPKPPEHVNLDSWDEIVEVSLSLTGEKPRLSTIDPNDGVEALPDFSSAQPGPYRIRVHARGRDHGVQVRYVLTAEGEEPVEEHLIQVWSAPPAPIHVLKLSDTYGKTMRP